MKAELTTRSVPGSEQDRTRTGDGSRPAVLQGCCGGGIVRALHSSGVALPAGSSQALSAMRTITLDTNVLRDLNEHERQGHEDAKRLLAMHKAATVRIQITTRFDNDVPDDPLKTQLNSLPIMPSERIGSVWRVGVTAVGSTDKIASEKESFDCDTIMSLLFPGASEKGNHHSNRIADVDHLIAHRTSGADFFVTNEKAILRNGNALQTRFGICVTSLGDFLALHDTLH